MVEKVEKQLKKVDHMIELLKKEDILLGIELCDLMEECGRLGSMLIVARDLFNIKFDEKMNYYANYLSHDHLYTLAPLLWKRINANLPEDKWAKTYMT
jgi:hypothetical protein